ncbi:hypothetical protein [Campylobacter sp. US33a]|uniref:Uncharacterized protein n=1 Tax=Campylobacter sp. CCS1377 TaxID=3158229 RepID=A0AAU7EAW9_9BACT|nr:hypothetical protein [Campylobacter sp. US33a]MCW1360887.1 hypothetical protein [Campylobacter jejuni]TEY00532.1 hypothetical protein ELQ16_08935 [Campylobacter sp. US33a]
MRKIVLQILCFSFIFMAIFAITRFFMLSNLVGKNSLMTYIYGLGHDMRTLSVAFLPLFLCGFLSYFNFALTKSKFAMTGGGNR